MLYRCLILSIKMFCVIFYVLIHKLYIQLGTDLVSRSVQASRPLSVCLTSQQQVENEKEGGGRPLFGTSKLANLQSDLLTGRLSQALPSQQIWIRLLPRSLPHVFVNTAGMSCWDVLDMLSFTCWMCASGETQEERERTCLLLKHESCFLTVGTCYLLLL